MDLINNLERTIEFFITISLELILLFLGISFLVGLMLEYVPPEKIQKAMGGNSFFGNIIGAGFGASIPELTMMAGIFKRKLVIAFVLTILVTAIMTGFLVEILV